MHRWSVIGSDDLATRVRAVLEGICFCACKLIEEDLKLKLRGNPVVVTGGGNRSRLWLEILANALNSPVRRGKSDVLLGAAMIACSGITPPVCGTEAVVVPDPCTARAIRASLSRLAGAQTARVIINAAASKDALADLPSRFGLGLR